MISGLFKLSYRDLLRHPVESALTAAGIALGVSVMLAIDLASTSALRAFEWSTLTITGRATHRIRGPSGEEPTVRNWVDLRHKFPHVKMAPMLSREVSVQWNPSSPARPVTLLALDPLSEGQFRNWLPKTSEARGGTILEPNSVAIASERKSEIRHHTISVLLGDHKRDLHVVAYIEPSTIMEASYLKNLLVVDLATAHKWWSEADLSDLRLTHIDLQLPKSESAQQTQQELETHVAKLSNGALWVEQANSQSTAAMKLLETFRLNLKALSFLSLLVGLLLIFGTIDFSVRRRESRMGILRTLGTQAQELGDMVLLQGYGLGLAGSLAGAVMGHYLAQIMTSHVLQTINDLYFAVHVADAPVRLQDYVFGVGLGLFATLGATYIPYRRAMAYPPRMNFQTRVAELPTFHIQTILRISLSLAALAVVITMCLLHPLSLILAFAALGVTVGVIALTTPPALEGLLRVLMFVFLRAPRVAVDVIWATRTTCRVSPQLRVSLAAVVSAFSVALGMDLMIGNFRNSVFEWLMSTMQADIYVSPKGFSTTHYDKSISPQFLEKMTNHGGIKSFSLSHHHTVSVIFPAQTLPIDFHAIAVLPIEGVAPYFQLLNGSREETWQRLQLEDAVLLSEVSAQHYGVQPGDKIEIATPTGRRPFQVLDFF